MDFYFKFNSAAKNTFKMFNIIIKYIKHTLLNKLFQMIKKSIYHKKLNVKNHVVIFSRALTTE